MTDTFKLQKHEHYDGLSESFEDSKWIFFGAPFDGTSSYRDGSRFAPEAIRKETVLCQETYSPYFDFDIINSSVTDVGNLELDVKKTDASLASIKSYTEHIVAHNKQPFMLGGEHLVSLPVIEVLLKKYPDLRIIQLDAHADMIDELFGKKYSHGTVMRRVFDQIGSERIYQFGIRSGSMEEIHFSQKHNRCNMFDLTISEAWIKELEGFPIYFTIDLDCFDPSQIPGTGTPETGGVFFNDYITFLKKIAHLNFVGIDVNELSPKIDPTNMSTVFATKVIREAIAGCIR